MDAARIILLELRHEFHSADRFNFMAELEARQGRPQDYAGGVSPDEAEKRKVVAEQAEDPEVAFRREMADLERIKAAGNIRLAAAQSQDKPALQSVPAIAAPASKVYQLLVAKVKGKFVVVGMYSDRAELAEALGSDEVQTYAAAGITLGNVEFDLAVKVNKAPVVIL